VPTRFVQTENSPLGVEIGMRLAPPETTSSGRQPLVSKYEE
jgi:hypothetical protein